MAHAQPQSPGGGGDSTPPSVSALAAGGVFARRVPDFTPRRAQQEMAAAVEDALAGGGVLVAESGTGTGKTFAYLTPIVLSGRRTIISTATKHLQEQIFHRDLPQVIDALTGALPKPPGAALLKGRANYLCRYRLKQVMLESELIDRAETRSFEAIDRWAAGTDSGDISEVSELSEESPLWKQVTSTADNCLGGQCPDFNACFVAKARQRALRADIVVVNHHLFFSDLTLKTEGFGELLPQHDAVVFDEAHSLADIASGFFGFSLSSRQIADLGHDALAAERDEGSGVPLADAVDEVDDALHKLLRANQRFADQSVDFDTLQDAKFDAAYEGLVAALAVLEAALKTAAAAGDGLRRCHERVLLQQANLDTWRSGGDSNLIRWAQIRRHWFCLHGTPLDISGCFGDMMGAAQGAWIFTSATLAVGDDFSAFCNQLGLQNAERRRWDSPYDFRRNALLYLPPDMPDPRADGYAEAVIEVIRRVTAASGGRAFCLFTSHAMMNRAHAGLGAADWPLLLQGQAPKSELLNRFARERAVLFGTASFWEGVDVKGEGLSCVIIDKLPFAPPTDPVLKNRLRACEEEGGTPFMDIQIPAAVIALKQGAGRLIRSETDRGVLVLCDPRLLGKGYGRLFLDSLPGMVVTRDAAEIAAFFGGG